MNLQPHFMKNSADAVTCSITKYAAAKKSTLLDSIKAAAEDLLKLPIPIQ